MLDTKIKERKLSKSILQFEYSWTYRILPTVFHKPFTTVDPERFKNWFSVFDKDDSRLHISPA